MSRDETQILKGVAILMMLWLHLFLNLDVANGCINFLFINGVPFSHILTKACRPVNIFLILGGYGLYCVYIKGNDKRRYFRIFRLYVHYWIVFALFVPLVLFLSPKTINVHSISIVIKSLMAYNTTWNTPCWFLLPYSILSLSYPFLFRLLDKYDIKLTLIIIISIEILQSQCYVSYQSFFKNHSMLILINNIAGYVEPFILGAILRKYYLVEKLKNTTKSFQWKSSVVLFILIIIITLKCSTSIFYLSIYEVSFIFLFLLINRSKWIDDVLMFFGKHSMNMWMIHHMIYFYFSDLTYSPKYPILIWIGLILMSLFSSCIVNLISKYIEKIVPIKC